MVLTGATLLSAMIAVSAGLMPDSALGAAIGPAAIAAGWLALMVWHDRVLRRASAARALGLQHEFTVAQGQLAHAFGQCASEFIAQFTAVQAELTQTQESCRDAADKLAASFAAIESQTQSQQRLTAEIASCHAQDLSKPGGAGFERLAAETTSTL